MSIPPDGPADDPQPHALIPLRGSGGPGGAGATGTPPLSGHVVGAGMGPRRPRGRRLTALLLIWPLAELLALVLVARLIGVWPTIGLLVLESLVGAWLVRREGVRTWRALVRTAGSGAVPSTQVLDAACVFAAGILLVLPGFLTDLAGLVLVLPPTRALGRRLLAGYVAARVGTPLMRRGNGGPTVVDSEVL